MTLAIGGGVAATAFEGEGEERASNDAHDALEVIGRSCWCVKSLECNGLVAVSPSSRDVKSRDVKSETSSPKERENPIFCWGDGELWSTCG